MVWCWIKTAKCPGFLEPKAATNGLVGQNEEQPSHYETGQRQLAYYLGGK